MEEEEELFHLEKEEKEGRVLTEELMSSVVLTTISGPFSDNFTGRYVEKEFLEDEQDDPIVQEVLMQVFSAQSQFHEIFGREWGSEDHRDLGSLKDYYFVPEYAVMKLQELFFDKKSVYRPFHSTPCKTPADNSSRRDDRGTV